MRTTAGWTPTTPSRSRTTTTPSHMGFRALRVINEDRVAPRRASARTRTGTWRSSPTCSRGDRAPGQHGHAGRAARGEVQRMTAGTGVLHSEMNRTRTEELHFLQIWILPERKGLTPSYEQKAFTRAGAPGPLPAGGVAGGAGRRAEGAPGPAAVQHAAGQGRADRVHAGPGPACVAAAGARRGDAQRRGAEGRGRRGRVRASPGWCSPPPSRSRRCCSTWPEARPQPPDARSTP